MWTAWAGNILIVFSIYLMFILLPLWFPDGRFLSSRWRVLAVATALVLGLLVLVTSYWPGMLTNLDEMGGRLNPNPFGLRFTPSPWLDQTMRLAPKLVLVVGSIPANASLFVRWRRSTGVVRQQIKWLAFFVVTAGMFFLIVELMSGLFFRDLLDTWLYLAALTITWLGYPIIIGIAVLRFRLYDIDLIIRRTLLYSSLTVILGAVYVLAIIVIQLLVRTVIPGGEESQIGIVLSTLGIAALFNPLRLQLQKLIDRRYFRSQYNAERILTRMSAEIRNEVEIDRLSALLHSTVDDAIHPETITILIKK